MELPFRSNTDQREIRMEKCAQTMLCEECLGGKEDQHLLSGYLKPYRVEEVY